MTYHSFPNPSPKSAIIHEVRLNASTSFTSGNIVTLNTLTSSHTSANVSLSNNAVTLKPGSYLIHGNVAIDRNNTAQPYRVDFYDNSTNAALSVSDGWFPATTAAANSPSGTYTSASVTLLAQVDVTAQVTFYLYSQGASGTLVADGTQLIVMEI